MRTMWIGSGVSRHVMWLMIVVALMALGAGCSKRDSSPMAPAAPVLAVRPADGATAVRLDAAIVLDFGLAVNRATVESGLHLVSEADMTTPDCPDATMGAHGTMETMMSDPAKLRHMESFHATRGRFGWNDAGTVCTFRPDSLMKPQMRYMVHMSGDMMQMMQQMGGTMSGGMMTGAGDMIGHFTTMNADGHAGHH